GQRLFLSNTFDAPASGHSNAEASRRAIRLAGPFDLWQRISTHDVLHAEDVRIDGWRTREIARGNGHGYSAKVGDQQVQANRPLGLARVASGDRLEHRLMKGQKRFALVLDEGDGDQGFVAGPPVATFLGQRENDALPLHDLEEAAGKATFAAVAAAQTEAE